MERSQQWTMYSSRVRRFPSRHWRLSRAALLYHSRLQAEALDAHLNKEGPETGTLLVLILYCPNGRRKGGRTTGEARSAVVTVRGPISPSGKTSQRVSSGRSAHHAAAIPAAIR